MGDGMNYSVDSYNSCVDHDRDLINENKYICDDANFFKDEFAKADAEIARLEKLKKSYLRSYLSNILRMIEKLYAVNDYNIANEFEKYGFEKTKYRVELLRNLLFDDENCEKLRKYNCISIENSSAPFDGTDKLAYWFFDGKTYFGIRIPYKDDIEHAMNAIMPKQNDYDQQRYSCYIDTRLMLHPFSYGTIELIYSNPTHKSGDILFDEVRIFESHNIRDLRQKLVELANSDFKEIKEKLKNAKENHTVLF